MSYLDRMKNLFGSSYKKDMSATQYTAEELKKMQLDMVSNDIAKLKTMEISDMDVCKAVAGRDINLLKEMKFTDRVKEELFETNSNLFKYIPEPGAELQAKAIEKEWTNVYHIEKFAPKGLTAFLEQMTGQVGMSFSSQQFHAAETLIGRWKQIEYEYMSIFAPEDIAKVLDSKGLEGYPKSLKNDVYMQSYKESVKAFQHDTGITLDWNSVSKIDSFVGETGAMRRTALSEGMMSPLSEKGMTPKQIHDDCSKNFLFKRKILNSDNRMTMKLLRASVGEERASQIEKTLSDQGMKVSDLTGKDVKKLTHGEKVMLKGGKAMSAAAGKVGFVIRTVKELQSVTDMGVCIQ